MCNAPKHRDRVRERETDRDGEGWGMERRQRSSDILGVIKRTRIGPVVGIEPFFERVNFDIPNKWCPRP